MTTRLLLALPVLSLALLPSACSTEDSDVPRSCTVAGCVDSLSLQLTTPGGDWSPGSYELTVTADGQASTCTFSLAGPLVDNGPVEGWTCSGALTASLRNELSCQGPSCSPVAGRFQLDVALDATPQQASVKLHHEGQLVTEQSVSPTYVESSPNGPGCAPVCQNATASLAVSGWPQQPRDGE